MLKALRYRTLVMFGVAGLILAVCLSCFGLYQRGSRRTRSTNTQIVVLVKASRSLVKLPPRTVDPAGLLCELTENKVRLSASATSPHKGYVNFLWEVPVGRLIGKGLEVTWDLSGVNEGTYTATVKASDSHKHTGSGSVTVAVVICPGSYFPSSPCPSVSVSCPSSVEEKTAVTFEATVQGGNADIIPTYKWTLTAGKIISGQATQKITIDVSGLSGKSVTATVFVGGFDPLCSAAASCSILSVEPQLSAPGSLLIHNSNVVVPTADIGFAFAVSSAKVCRLP